MDKLDHSLPEQPDAASRFPDTLWSIVLAAGGQDESKASDALGRLCAAYHQPMCRWLQSAGHDPHQAEEAVQDFIFHLLHRQRLPLLSPSGPRFRVWLLTCLRHRLRDRREAAAAAKRGGGISHLPLNQLEIPGTGGSPDRLFDLHCAAALHERVLSSLLARWQETGDQARFQVLRQFILTVPESGDYQAVGHRLGLRPQQVKRIVFRLREQYFDAFRAAVSQTVTPEDAADEMRHLASFLPDLAVN